MEIRESSNVPDSTYFRTGDAEPEINDDGSITVLDGSGKHRSWGAPGVTSTVIVDEEEFAAVHVGFHHKHGGSQFWRYYIVNGATTKVTWGKLDDETRAKILVAYEEKAPSWAKVPGKLRKEYKKPDPKANAFTGYKIVDVDEDGTLHSLYDDGVTYEIGRTMVQKSKRFHNGGWYVYTDSGKLMEDYASGQVIGTPKVGKKALVKCECWGNREYYNHAGEWVNPSWFGRDEWYDPCDDSPDDYIKKIAVTYCKPLEIVDTFEVS